MSKEEDGGKRRCLCVFVAEGQKDGEQFAMISFVSHVEDPAKDIRICGGKGHGGNTEYTEDYQRS